MLILKYLRIFKIIVIFANKSTNTFKVIIYNITEHINANNIKDFGHIY